MPPPVLRVALPLPLPTLFDYLPDDPDAPAAGWVGCRVRVRVGPRLLVGLVAAVAEHSEAPGALRTIETRLDPAPLIEGELWTSLHWLADYYRAPLGEVLALALPVPLRQGEALPEPDRDRFAACPEAPPRVRPGGRPAALWEALSAGPCGADDLALIDAGWRPRLRRWEAEGRLRRLPPEPPAPRPAHLALNAEQQAAVDALRGLDGFAPVLLQGVTGSGKTEVYLELLADVLAAGGQALVLVPEIALTPQTVRRFRARLGDAVRVLHSGLADGERAQAWTAMARGEPGVLVGTRSAALAPLPRGRLIIIDEEHDGSYKQQDGVRYSARDLLLVRGQALRVPVLLGSATPSLESLQQVERGRYRRLALTRRAGAGQPPEVTVLDVRAQRLQGGLARESLAAIEATLVAGGQVLVFRNRRGFAPVLLCHDCGYSAQCQRCDSAMTVHAGGRRLHCHHCGAQRPPPNACPDCGSLGLQPQGQGTERLEAFLAERFREVPVVRIDRDSTRRRDALVELLGKLGERPGILVGTQMLAKGHDLAQLALVVVVGVDEGLYSPDFRAAERLSQLLIQVAGRAGRAERRGRVLLQTHHPQHPLLATLLSGGYPAAASELLAERRLLGYPPAAHWALIRAEAQQDADWQGFLDQARTLLAEPALDAGVDLRGPLPAPKPRRAGFQRGQLLLAAGQRPALQRVLDATWRQLHSLPLARRVRWSLDVDPVDLF
ncbi:primosomal protein N' [Pseudomarimonas salicorniae]|uniref:Replication restart protein PriA n=1 Tax=Pseudomarimonas salicorniae TaxID=2933270 RepID=A0ABT0GD57_9GAMM|nr:primosomal protein N' [Lysobacter sp. CAU 1642]MCK7592477.1 primosomal protein N' [Lysobacter sp. CAU 1642]